MKKTLKKWSLWVCGVVTALCLGFGVGLAAILPVKDSNVMAKAETVTYTVNAIRPDVDTTATALYIVPQDGDGGSFGVGNWDDVFAFTAGSGTGLTLNGELLETKDIKQPGSFFINLGVTPVSGDVLILDGKWAYGEKIIHFTDCSLYFNGTSWETCSAVALGSVTVSGDADTLTLTSQKTLTAGKSLSLVVGGISVNEDLANDRVASIVTTANGITFTASMEDAVADVVHLNGLFTDGTVYYAVMDSYFIWEGTQWRVLTGYNAIVSKALPRNDGQAATGFYLPVNGDLGIAGDWDKTALVNGHGLKLNGKILQNGAIKFVSKKTLYVDLAVAAQAGDVLTINGLYMHSSGSKVLFAPSQALRFNGSAWEHLQYTTYDLDEMTVASAPTGTATATTLYLMRKDSGWMPISSPNPFAYESGMGVKKNGADVEYTLKSMDGNVVLELSDVQVGDVISVGGTFTCGVQQVRYAILDGYFKWNGTSWELGEAYVKTEIDSIFLDEEGDDRNGFFVCIDHNVGITSWDVFFTLENGAGVLLNGEPVDAYIKPLGERLYLDVERVPVQNGDVLTIEGTFICKVDGVTSEVVFTKVQALKWNGMRWDVDSTATYNLGDFKLHVNSSVGGASGFNNQLYLERMDDEELPVANWQDLFVHEKGDGLMINGVPKTIYEMKSTPDGFWFSFDGVSAGDVVTLSGTFVCEEQGVRYIIKESYFDWDGARWSADVVYTSEYKIQYLQPTAPSTNAGATNAQVYLKINGSTSLPVTTWDYKFVLRKGDGLMVNGVPKTIYEMKSAPEGLWMRFDGVSAGDVVTLSGTFVCKDLQTKYEIAESAFKYDGSRWVIVVSYTDEDLEDYDTVTNIDLGWDLTRTFGGLEDLTDRSYVMSEDNTTGSIKFRFDYYSTNVASDSISFRLRGADAWDNNIHVHILWGGIFYHDQKAVYNFENNTHYVIELGAITIKNSSEVWTYIKVGGVFVDSELRASAAITNRLSIYVEAIGQSAVMTDPDHVRVLYNGGNAAYAEKNGEYQLIENTNPTFIGWASGNALYQAGETISVGEADLAFTAFVLDFVLKEGAAIRLSATADDSGIRFTTMINTQQLNELANYGVQVSFGTLIMPYDYLGAGQAPNLSDFVAGSTVLQIPNTVYTEQDKDNSAYTVYYGAMKKLFTQNYARNFAGRGYMIVTYTNGMTKTVYTPFNVEDNVRSVRTVAQKFMADTAEYEKISVEKKAVVEAYANSPDYGTSKASATSVASVQEAYAAAFVYGNKQNIV